MVESVFGPMSVNTHPLENHYHEGNNMLGEIEITEPPEIQIAEEGHQVLGCGTPSDTMVPPEPLVLLIEVTQVDGSTLPLGTFMVRSVVHQIIGLTRREGFAVEITCLMMTHPSHVHYSRLTPKLKFLYQEQATQE